MGVLIDIWKHIKTDGWENAVTMLGTSYASLSHHSMRGSLWLEPEELGDLYVGDPIARRLILEPYVSAFEKGYDLSPPAEMDTTIAQEQEKAIRDKLDELGAVEALVEFLAWGELYGRGGLLLGAVDGSMDPAEPLDKERVTELRWLAPLTTEEFSALSLDDDPASPTYGEPVTWQVRRGRKGTPVETHTSRLLLSGSVPTSLAMREDHEWRDIPALQAVYEDLRNYNSGKTGMAQMLVDASQAVLKIMDLPAILSDDDTLLKARLRILEMARALHIMPINAGDVNGAGAEDFQYVERTFSGVADTSDRLLGALSSGAGWPQTKLFGRSPAGENATGESDRENWDDLVLGKQRDKCIPPFQVVVSLVAQVLGFDDGWTVGFAPLRQLTPTEQSALDKTVAETDAIYITNDVYDPSTVARFRFGGDEVNRNPVMIPKDVLEALEALQGQDLERALEGPPEEPEGSTSMDLPEGVKPSEESPLASDPGAAYNGAQTSTMVEAAIKVSEGILAPASAIAILQIAYPVTGEQAASVINPAAQMAQRKAEEPTSMDLPFEPPEGGEEEGDDA